MDIDKKDRPNTLMIGSNNVFEVGCTVLAKVIGDNNVFESKCMFWHFLFIFIRTVMYVFKIKYILRLCWP